MLCIMTNANPMPIAEVTVVFAPCARERCTVAWTVSNAVHGAINATSVPSTPTDMTQAVVAAMTALMANRKSEVVSGALNHRSEERRVGKEGRGQSRGKRADKRAREVV